MVSFQHPLIDKKLFNTLLNVKFSNNEMKIFSNNKIQNSLPCWIPIRFFKFNEVILLFRATPSRKERPSNSEE